MTNEARLAEYAQMDDDTLLNAFEADLNMAPTIRHDRDPPAVIDATGMLDIDSDPPVDIDNTGLLGKTQLSNENDDFIIDWFNLIVYRFTASTNSTIIKRFLTYFYQSYLKSTNTLVTLGYPDSRAGQGTLPLV